MGIFELRNHLVGDYESYVGSFPRIKDARINEQANRSLGDEQAFAEACGAVSISRSTATSPQWA
ncbi:MAG TPA: hypothetical protein VNA27_02025 [Rubrobacteraceae bacterium]|nr:hypothetical protein [Rubrobacteraceae bacterium]